MSKQSEDARFDGQDWVIELLFTRGGMVRMRKIQKWTGEENLAPVIARAVVALSRYWPMAERGMNVYAQLGNDLKRFDFLDIKTNRLFAKRIETADIRFVLRIPPQAHAVMTKVAKRTDQTMVRMIYSALLYYEWHVRHSMTGHLLRVGKLYPWDDPKQ